MTGQDESGDLPVNGFQPIHSDGCSSGYKDGFIAKLDIAGSMLLYSSYLGGSSCNPGWGIAVDSAQNAYVMGETTTPNFPITANAVDPTFNGVSDIFICYDVRLQQQFQPFEVRLRDQFEEQGVRVLRPTTLCNPAVKCVGHDCTPILNPDAHLVCYETDDDQGTPQFELREVIVSNQFGKEQRLTVWRRKNMLCAPSLKAHVGQQQ